MDTFNLCTLNARGLKNKLKRKSLFKELKTKNMDIISLQETYLTRQDLKVIKREMGGTIHISPAVGRSMGLISFFSNKIEQDKIELIYEAERILISKIPFNNDSLFIINIYSPCNDSDKLIFLNKLDEVIKNNIPLDQLENIVCMGDFNMVRDNDLDILAGGPHSIRNVNAFNKFIDGMSFHDIWRENNIKVKNFTWSRGKAARRLDYIFLGNQVMQFSTNTNIQYIGLTDHRLVTTSITPECQSRGPGSYKINTALFRDKHYVEIIIECIERCKLEYANLNDQLRWEMIKTNIRETTQQYSRFFGREKRNEKQNILDSISHLEGEYFKDPDDDTLGKKLLDLKKKRELILIEETKASSIRAGIKWIQEGEKNNKFFLGLEKSRNNANTIHCLKSQKDSNTLLNSSGEILSEIREYFQKLYKEDKTDEEILNSYNNFINDLNICSIQENDENTIDTDITEKELLNALKKLKNGSSPGSDSIPTEFYKFFWHQIKDPLFKSFLFALKSKTLSFTQRRGLITLIHKGNNSDKNCIKNWRPISLMNSDYKILTKLLAMRFQGIIHTLVNENQSGFIKGRNISNIIREIDDIIENEKKNKSENLILTVDFEKAFDTISSKFIVETFRSFGFGSTFLTWIEIIMKDRTACIKNNGYISEEFELQRGIRQGCPISPLLFVVAVELLAIKTRQESSVKGIKIYENFTKIRQYADDTTFLLGGVEDLSKIMSILELFSKCSGLLINKSKSKACCPGKPNRYGRELFGIEISPEIKLLGVYFSVNENASNFGKNWETRLNKTEKLLNGWLKRDLTIMGKVLILKTFALSNFVHLMQSIGMPETVSNSLNAMFFRFIWSKGHSSNKKIFEKVKRKVLCNTYEYGGVNMFNMTVFQKGFYLDWVERLLSPEKEEWKILPKYNLKKYGGTAIFESNLDVKRIKHLENNVSNFWYKAIQVWLENKTSDQIKNSCNTEGKINCNEVIFNNLAFSYKKQHIWIPECIENGILRLRDVMLDDRVMTLNEFRNSYPNIKNAVFAHNIITNACNKYGGRIERNTNTDHNIYFRGLLVGQIGRKGFLKLLQDNEKSHIVAFWKRKLAVDIDKDHWTASIKATKEIRLQELHWKILNNIYPTNILLHKMKLRESNACDFCLCEDFIEHFFVHCEKVQPVWIEIEKQLMIILNRPLKLELTDKLIGLKSYEKGLSKKEKNIINHAILIGKITISKYRYGMRFNIIDMLHREANLRQLW